MDENFLLTSETARRLYHEYAKGMPVIDYHCHIDAKEIADDVKFENITQLWLGGDHYKWRYMRSCGVEEKYITGDASDKEKFFKWAEVLGYAIGNPLYHWSHLELQRYFGITTPLNKNTAGKIWEEVNAKLQHPDFSARNIIRKSNVALLCTTDDPADSLEYHAGIAADASFDVKVLPAFRPDAAMNLDKTDYLQYLARLEKACGFAITSFSLLKKALRERMLYFHNHGCVLADHGLDRMVYTLVSDTVAEDIFAARLRGEVLSEDKKNAFFTAFLLFVHREYAKLNWTSQLHFGCKRDNNSAMYEKIGANTGFDCIRSDKDSGALADFLNALDITNELPRTILYSLDPNDNAAIGTIIGCFQDASAVSKIQHGSAWWFNDHLIGMQNHLANLASLRHLAGFVGMLTDSRSFLSYTRHEYFRRILCEYIGSLVERGEFPADFDTLGEIIRNISYYNAVRYFRFQL